MVRAKPGRLKAPRRRQRKAPWLLATALSLVATLAAAAGCGGSGATATAGNAASKTTTITFGTVLPTASGINILVAKDEGFLAKNGINLQVKNLSDALTVLSDVGKSYNMAASFPPQEIIGLEHGLNITVVSGLSDDSTTHPETGIVVPAGSTITSAAGLVGKTVGCVGLTDDLYEGFLYWLHEHGIKESAVNGVEVPTIAQQAELSAHKINAAVATYPSIDQMTGVGMKNLGDPLRAVGSQVQALNLVTTPAWAAAHKTVLAHLRTALDQTDAWMAANPSKVGPILQKYSKQSSAAVKEILGDLPDYSTTFTQAQFNEWITVLKTVVPNFQDTVTYQQLAAGLS
jgi:NitT/TauT family transport system substrate-binding protein